MTHYTRVKLYLIIGDKLTIIIGNAMSSNHTTVMK